MNKIIIITIFLLISNCTLNKVIKHHGVHYLDKKQEKLILSNTNKNDIIKILGPPSTKSTFDNDVWIYIVSYYSQISMLNLNVIDSFNFKYLYNNDIELLSLLTFGLKARIRSQYRHHTHYLVTLNICI